MFKTDKIKMELQAYLHRVASESAHFYISNDEQGNYDPHTHTKAQLTYVEQGVTVLYVGEKSYFIPASHYVWIPAGVQHQFVHRNTAQCVRTIFVDPSPYQSDAFYTTLGIYPITNLIVEMLLYATQWRGAIYSNTMGYQFVDTLVLILPHNSQHSLPFTLPTTENPHLSPILKYIHHNLQEELTLQHIGTTFGYGSRTLSRLFSANIKMTFFQYLKLTRMIKAMELLVQTDLSIGEIAFKVGYTSISSFSNVFKEITKSRPTEFIKQNKKAILAK